VNDRSDTITLAEAAQRAGVNRSTLMRAMQAGTVPVPFLKIGKSVRIPKRRFFEWLSGDSTTPANGGAAPPPATPPPS